MSIIAEKFWNKPLLNFRIMKINRPSVEVLRKINYNKKEERGGIKMEKQTLGQKIAKLRKEKNMTQLELANILNITDKAVSKWERDISCPDINTFPKLAETLGVSVDELLKTNISGKEKHEENNTFDMVLKAVPLAMSVAVIILTFVDRLYWEDTATLLGIAVLAFSIKNFREK